MTGNCRQRAPCTFSKAAYVFQGGDFKGVSVVAFGFGGICLLVFAFEESLPLRLLASRGLNI